MSRPTSVRKLLPSGATTTNSIALRTRCAVTLIASHSMSVMGPRLPDDPADGNSKQPLACYLTLVARGGGGVGSTGIVPPRPRRAPLLTLAAPNTSIPPFGLCRWCHVVCASRHANYPRRETRRCIDRAGISRLRAQPRQGHRRSRRRPRRPGSGVRLACQGPANLFVRVLEPVRAIARWLRTNQAGMPAVHPGGRDFDLVWDASKAERVGLELVRVARRVPAGARASLGREHVKRLGAAGETLHSLRVARKARPRTPRAPDRHPPRASTAPCARPAQAQLHPRSRGRSRGRSQGLRWRGQAAAGPLAGPVDSAHQPKPAATTASTEATTNPIRVRRVLAFCSSASCLGGSQLPLLCFLLFRFALVLRVAAGGEIVAVGVVEPGSKAWLGDQQPRHPRGDGHGGRGSPRHARLAPSRARRAAWPPAGAGSARPRRSSAQASARRATAIRARPRP